MTIPYKRREHYPKSNGGTVPTISDLKDQARSLEQQGQFDKALTIYQHILKHLEGTPALTKVLPLYVKAGDLLVRMERPQDAVASYQTAAEHYASSGAAPRVTALCGKIIRLAPDRQDVYTDFVRHLIQHGHVGSARDVLADYARYAGMDRAIETLDDLAGRPNHEVQPMLERLLNSFELDDQSERAAERVSSQLEQVTDNLAGELSGVPETELEAGDYEPDSEDEGEEDVDKEDRDLTDGEEESANAEAAESGETSTDGDPIDGPEPLTPPMLDLDHMSRQSSMHEAIRLDEDDDEDRDEDMDADQEKPTEADADAPETDEESDFEFTSDVTPTMDGMLPVSATVDESTSDDIDADEQPDEEPLAVEKGLDSLLADAMASEETADTPDAGDTPGAVEIEGSEWKPDFPAPKAEETVAAEWSPEEELEPAARYPSDEYETPDTDGASDEDDGEESASAASDTLDEEIARAVEGFGTEATVTEEATPAAEDADDASPLLAEEPAFAAPSEPDAAVGPESRPSRPPRMMVPEQPAATSKSPMMFGIGGLVVGALAGAGLTFMLLGGGSDNQPVVEQPAAVVDSPATQLETPAPAQPEPEAATPAIQPPAEVEVPNIDSAAAAAVDTAGATEAVPDTTNEASPDTTTAAAATELAADPLSPAGNPIVVEGMAIDEISEIEYSGRPGYRVVHLLDWGDPIVIEAVRDTSVTSSTFIQVTVTPPDTVVGIRRLDGYMVYASGVMPEDSLRSLMLRLVEGQSPSN